MKRRDQEQAIAKLTSSGGGGGGGGRDDLLIIFMWTKKAMLAAVVVVVAKCRELWEGVLTAGSGCGCVSRSAAAADDDDGYYFGRSYEFSCSATPVAFAPAKGAAAPAALPAAATLRGSQAGEGDAAGGGDDVPGAACRCRRRSTLAAGAVAAVVEGAGDRRPRGGVHQPVLRAAEVAGGG
ncbi:hypothetical protein OsJ_06953 [Oryza sativa Japonica Group]|uniref:Uncharacterized protein n=1 Tax=Oryza sativa subsp. japonica TaxID=39947 RepID=A3A7G9_ORYSJ|nr:hypothetical protein OsJ_06953 [Oryza sativa Japonica Group]